MNNWARMFFLTVGAMSLFMSTALFHVNLSIPKNIAPVNDPVFGTPLPLLFWISGGIGTVFGLVCLFAQNAKLPTILVVLSSVSYLLYRTYVSISNGSHGLTGYLGEFGKFLGIQARAADTLLVAINFYLLTGCFVTFFMERKRNPRLNSNVSERSRSR